MKKLIYLPIFLLLAACNYFDVKSMKFSLEVENLDINRIALHKVVDGKRIFIDSIYKKQWQHAKDFDIYEPGKYFLAIDKLSGISFYIQKGFNIKINLDRANRFSYEGKGASENEYLLRDANHPIYKNEDWLFRSESNVFLARLNKIFSPFDELFDENDLDNEFWKEAVATQKLIKSVVLLRYTNEYKARNHKKPDLCNGFFSEIENTNFNSETILINNNQLMSEFINLFGDYLFNKTNTNEGLTNAEKINKTFECIHNYFSNEKVCEKMMYNYATLVISILPSEEMNEGLAYYFEYSNKKLKNNN